MPPQSQLPRAPARAFFAPPAWLALDRGDRLDVLEFWGGDRLELTGDVRQALLEGQATSALTTLARFNPTLARLAEALAKHPLLPLDRATLLRGTGFGQLFVELTARCNERCRHCYAESSPARTEQLDRDTVWRVLDDALALGFASVQLTGGDPLVSDLCAPAAERARAIGIPHLEVYTNGLALGGSLYERLRDCGVAFAFSFYSHDAATHDHITGTPGSQRRTLAAIERVFADGLSGRVNVIVMDDNHDHLEDTVVLLEARGVPRAQIGMDVQRSVGRGLMTIRPKDSGIDATGVGTQLGGHRSAASEGFAGRAAVSYDGVVYPCIFSRGFALGSVRERSLRAILEEALPLALDVEAMLAEYVQRESALACWDCRLRASLLSSQP